MYFNYVILIRVKVCIKLIHSIHPRFMSRLKSAPNSFNLICAVFQKKYNSVAFAC